MRAHAASVGQFPVAAVLVLNAFNIIYLFQRTKNLLLFLKVAMEFRKCF